jgi:asparagine synthase (glutamine-hydrolysing)
MSVQFGRWNFAGEKASPGYVDQVDAALVPFGPDGSHSHCGQGITILYKAFHTTKESHRERQPYVLRSGEVLTWDGRLDNRQDLLCRLPNIQSPAPPDVAIVAAAYQRWGTECFAHLVGDWALSIWNPGNRSLLLAKDFAGTRHLYYAFDEKEAAWCTILDPLVLAAGRTVRLNEEYIAGWFSFFPAAHLTPYRGICAVPPSSFVLLQPGRCTIKKYWDFDPGKRIRYRTDGEYQEHFRSAFAEAVLRRLRSDRPILAELSGGMDSSSIVCMADRMIGRGALGIPRLDTVSYYNDSDPDWNERPYFTKVEAMRGRVGCHINVGTPESVRSDFQNEILAVTPTSGWRVSEASRQFAACLESQGNRVLLSGVGGDEVTGGVPTPTPELMDLLARAQFNALARQLKRWALNKRKPWFHLLFECLRAFAPVSVADVPDYMRPPLWLDQVFVRRYRQALSGYRSRIKLFGALPSFQDYRFTLDALRRQLACLTLPAMPSYEKRYPFLDRTLLEFLYAIPREQLLRPGERRSLMRRALFGMIPDEVLHRKRKAFAAKSPIATISADWNSLMEKDDQMMSHNLGIVDRNAFSREIERVRSGQDGHVVAISRALVVEAWLRTIRQQGILNNGPLPSSPVPGDPGEQIVPANSFR